MRLYPLSSKLATSILGFSRKVKIDVISLFELERIDRLVVIANGTPDDIALSIISHHLDGTKSVGIVKPTEHTGLGTLYLTKIYSEKFRRIMFLMDLEKQDVASVFDEAAKKLLSIGVDIDEKENLGMLAKFDCEVGSRGFDLILVVNGLKEMPFEGHSIEDHLLLKAKEVEPTDLKQRTSKQVWNSFDSKTQLRVYIALANKAQKIDEVFPQQVHACRLLME